MDSKINQTQVVIPPAQSVPIQPTPGVPQSPAISAPAPQSVPAPLSPPTVSITSNNSALHVKILIFLLVFSAIVGSFFIVSYQALKSDTTLDTNASEK